MKSQKVTFTKFRFKKGHLKVTNKRKSTYKIFVSA